MICYVINKFFFGCLYWFYTIIAGGPDRLRLLTFFVIGNFENRYLFNIFIQYLHLCFLSHSWDYQPLCQANVLPVTLLASCSSSISLSDKLEGCRDMPLVVSWTLPRDLDLVRVLFSLAETWQLKVYLLKFHRIGWKSYDNFWKEIHTYYEVIYGMPWNM